MRRNRKIILILLFLILIFYFDLVVNTEDSDIWTRWEYFTYQYVISKGVINGSFPIKFYHEAYLDLRTSPPRLRLYSLNPCIRKSNLLLIDVFFNNSPERKRTEVTGEPLEGYCPSTYRPAAHCFYNPHVFSVEIEEERKIEKVEVILGDRKVSLTVKEVIKEREDGLTVCVQPVYYYSQWQNILLYVEAWRAHGARRIIVFFHSASRETLSVLRHYETLGAIELRPWPSFGSPRQKGFPSVDESVFIFSYYLAMNICLQEVRTSLATVADFDEVLVPIEGSLLDYSLAEMKNSNVGALRFESNHVAMHPSIYSNDFSGVASPILVDSSGPPKHIFNASAIDVAQVHYIKSFIVPKVTKIAKGGLLHFRYGLKTSKHPKGLFRKSLSFFPNQTETHIKNIHETANTIYNGNLPKFNEDFIKKIKSCGTQISSQRATCLSKSGKCKEEMDKLYDWVYDRSEDIFRS